MNRQAVITSLIAFDRSLPELRDHFAGLTGAQRMSPASGGNPWQASESLAKRNEPSQLPSFFV